MAILSKKKYPKKFELAIFTALSYYPQLQDIDITFKEVDSPGSLYSQIEPVSLLLPWQERKYVVLIDTSKEKTYLNPTLLKSMPFSSQVGVLGHELGHTISYMEETGLGLALFALRYQTSSSFQQKIENENELRTIRFGLGPQLRAWSEHQYHIKVREKKDHLYFSPAAIDSVMLAEPAY